MFQAIGCACLTLGPHGSRFGGPQGWQRATAPASRDVGGASRRCQLSFAAHSGNGAWCGGMFVKERLRLGTSRSVQRAEAGSDDYADIDVRAILSDPAIEGDPLQLLEVTEAYWAVRRSVRPLSSVPRAESPVIPEPSALGASVPRTVPARIPDLNVNQIL